MAPAVAATYHVASNGDDHAAGSAGAPFHTIQQAANVAHPGDVVTVHAGTYRERISPPRGGLSDRKRITYQAAPREQVEIKGSEVVTNWVPVHDDVWQATLPNTFFGGFNPYRDLIHGDWFNPKGRQHHTGAVYLNGEWLTEAAKLADVLNPASTNMLWFAEVDATNTTIWAQFPGVNPNANLVEINVRQTVFYPEQTGINYITVRGFALRHAATPWAPPTAEQIGLIGTHWSRGWIIESNRISHSICTGVTLGKYGDEWDNRAESAEGYVGTIQRALTNGWNSATVGHHLVRGNDISHCEQGGIVGSLGCAFSTVTGNTIHDIHVRRRFSGAEMAGIKFHGAIDVEISHNHIYRTDRGVWLDWMAQGARITGNLFHDNHQQDLFLEVDHGPFLADNNLFLSSQAVLLNSQGGAFAHNLFAGNLGVINYDARLTPLHRPHSTEVVRLTNNPSGDMRFYNNLFVGRGETASYDKARLPVAMAGNVFLAGARPSKFETAPLLLPDFPAGLKLDQQAGGCYLELNYDPAWSRDRTRQLVTTKRLDRAIIPDAAFEQPDGKAIRLNTDYFGVKRNESNPMPGPFEHPGQGELSLKVW